MSTSAKKHYDLLILIPLEEEYLQFQNVFPFKESLSNNGTFISEVNSGNADLTALSVVLPEEGKSVAAQAIDEVLERFSISLIVCIGIAGSISKDLNLGDVCYSGNILDVLDNSKALDEDEGGISISLSPTQYKSPKSLSRAADFVRILPPLQSSYRDWQDLCEAKAVELLPPDLIGRDRKVEKISKPVSKKGTIVCGAVSSSKSYQKKLLELDRKALAIETESGGVFERAERYGIPAITIRGVSDYADSNKQELEEKTKGKLRDVAAFNAATFLKLQLQNEEFSRQFRNDETAVDGVSQFHTTPQAKNNIPDLISNVGSKIEERLNDLSPEYKLLPKGFVLPIPRIRRIASGLQNPKNEAMFEVRDVLQNHKNLFLSIHKGYPEKSLAWLIADELIQSSIDDKQLLPIVVDGNQVKPPNYSIEFAAESEFKMFDVNDPVQPVIIFDGVPLHSKTKMEFIINQMALHKNAKFIFVDRSSSNLFFEGEFEAALGAKPYEICEISFAQMSHFVQKNFEMNSTEANVIALRLRNAFHKFSLPAHPTYFAGIPRNTLTALTQANRRAELMEIAVVGFMTFVVADDASDIQLSRSTRTRFLKQLLISMWVEKETFNKAKLISYTESFAKKFDFEIEPIEFIKGFLDKGIIHFQEDRLEISLPFIEHYLLASALSENESLAIQYFDLENEDFDYATFDLYSEIGPSPKIVNEIIETLGAALVVLDDDDTAKPFLWSSEIEDKVNISKQRIDSLQERIEEAIKSVVENKDDTHDKQQMLDASDRVHTSIVERQIEELEDNGNSPIDDVGILTQLWTIGIYLLGSGAEHLSASTKRQLVERCTAGAGVLIEDWTRFQFSMDFQDLKQDLTSEQNINSFLQESPSERTPEEVKKMFEDMLDALQMMFLAMPFHKILGFICEHAQAPVLCTSVQQTNVETEFNKFTKAIWLSEINVAKGKHDVVQALKSLPSAPFFRVCTAMHFMTRVYWNHAKKSHRLQMLEYADQVLKPTSVRLGKQQIKRMIEKNDAIEKS